MMSLIVVVISIALTAFFLYGGISYFSHDLNIKVEVSHIANAHYEVMVMAVINYKVVNDGRMPADIVELNAYLPNGKQPQFPKFDEISQPYEWAVDGDYLCMYRTSTNQKYAGVDKGVHRFINGHSRQNEVKVSSNCAAAAAGSATTDSVGFSEDYILARNSIAFAFKVN